MTDKIIALVDGSIYARSVCDHAAWISARTGAGVELLHVLGRRGAPQRDLSGAIKLGARTALLNELTELDARRSKLAAEQGRAILEDAYSILAQDGVTEITSRLRHGDLVETVHEVEHGASLIVVGKRGEAADFARGHLGSNLERVVRASSKPILVASRTFKPVETMLIAYDGGASSEKAVKWIASDPLFKELSVTLAHVGEASQSVRAGLEAAGHRLEEAGLSVTTVVEKGQPDAVLGRLVEGGVGLVVMGAYGHSRIRSMIIGSTTSEMIRSCKAPVLLVR